MSGNGGIRNDTCRALLRIPWSFMRKKANMLAPTPAMPPIAASTSDSAITKKKIIFLFAPIDLSRPISRWRSWATIAAMSAIRGSAMITTNIEITFRRPGISWMSSAAGSRVKCLPITLMYLYSGEDEKTLLIRVVTAFRSSFGESRMSIAFTSPGNYLWGKRIDYPFCCCKCICIIQ